ncbi:hypothetical protein [Coxiella-like endosymbiont of Rhipicephalus sanguineus]|uniref:hypothetical protein n=1 Tax=Coxiella-like endosymbiont of Rhipicephalus sanguineus TaxID=1955402 RepID=UPI0020419026|nr:hypothetical protein [Coxiella-like endosymbiont of Rhipicephalus sanguineus]
MTSVPNPETTHSILELIKQVNRESKLLILLITHEMEIIKTVAQRVAVLDPRKNCRRKRYCNFDIVTLFK